VAAFSVRRRRTYRPPAWQWLERPGAIEFPPGVDLLILEGVGAGRLASWMTEENAHLASDRPWARARWWVAGAPYEEHDPETQLLLAPAPHRRQAGGS
jgi:hypothetical protein